MPLVDLIVQGKHHIQEFAVGGARCDQMSVVSAVPVDQSHTSEEAWQLVSIIRCSTVRRSSLLRTVGKQYKAVVFNIIIPFP